VYLSFYDEALWVDEDKMVATLCLELSHALEATQDAIVFTITTEESDAAVGM
jgi:hypothetical protein